MAPATGNQPYFPDCTNEKDTVQRDKKLNIAIISGFVKRNESKARISGGLADHMVNKACYADLWGYDYIHNTTWGFDNDVGSRYWLEYGTWHRVPHMQAALPKYDWILYVDTDWVVQDLSVPIESFLKGWELQGMKNVSPKAQVRNLPK